MAGRTGTGDVDAVRVSDPELAFESIGSERESDKVPFYWAFVKAGF